MARRRTKYLIEPRLQLRFALAFVGVASLYVLLHSIVFRMTLDSAMASVPEADELLAPAFLEGLRWNFFLTILVLVPLTVSLGVLMTHRIVGPLYRFRMYLTEVAEGRATGPCKLRRGDELQELCAIVNRATRPLWNPSEPDSEADPSAEEELRKAA